MKLPETLIPARIVRRENRFAALVEVGGRPVLAHVANTGRLVELMRPGRVAYLVPVRLPSRKTAYDLLLVDVGGALVSADARLPPVLVAEAIVEGRIAGFSAGCAVRHEVPIGRSRVDLMVETPGGPHAVETKSVTLVVDGCGRFPDARTARGAKHADELAGLARAGRPATIAWVIQRHDAGCLVVDGEADPTFRAAAGRAGSAGVALRAFRCQVSLEEIAIEGEVPVRFLG